MSDTVLIDAGLHIAGKEQRTGDLKLGRSRQTNKKLKKYVQLPNIKENKQHFVTSSLNVQPTLNLWKLMPLTLKGNHLRQLISN